MSKQTYIEKVVGDTFLCKKCLIFTSPPIYQCTNGHIICNPCYEKDKCNFCGGERNESRSHALEEIHSKIRFPCRNRPRDCLYIGLWDDVKEHEKSCPKSPSSMSNAANALGSSNRDMVF